MSENNQPIIIKRVKKIKKAGHHGGAWKIAYADFVTAMMAFFLIMWILALLNKSQLTSVAEYFKHPTKKGLVDKGTKINKDQQHDYYVEKGNQKSNWKALDNNKKTEDEKEKQKTQSVQIPMRITSVTTQNPNANMQKLEQVKQDLENKMDKDPVLRQFKNQLNFIITADGLKIELRDLENKPMFSKGRTDFEKYANTILSWLSNELNNYPNQIVITGHTDTIKFSGDNYTNWELSADRANATRRALIKFGMMPDKILRIVGEGDKELLDKKNGMNPSNRRIDILVLSDEAMKKLQHNP